MVLIMNAHMSKSLAVLNYLQCHMSLHYTKQRSSNATHTQTNTEKENTLPIALIEEQTQPEITREQVTEHNYTNKTGKRSNNATVLFIYASVHAGIPSTQRKQHLCRQLVYRNKMSICCSCDS